MELLSTIFYFIIAIFILVTAHEFGHFITARMFGMRVDRFFIGFDFWGIKLWQKKIGETEYGIGAFPIGGYVKIAGMIDESMDTEHVTEEVKPWEFRAKPVWQRLIVLAGGVAMNMVLAAVIFIGITGIFGESHTLITTPAFIEPNSVFSSMGMQSGDHLVAINGQKLQYWEEALDPERLTSGKLQYTIERNGKELTLTAPKDIISWINGNQSIGIRPTVPPVIDQVLTGGPAAKAGIMPGGLITAINDSPVTDWSEVVNIISKNAGKKLVVTWMHLKSEPTEPLTSKLIRKNGQTFTTEVVPNTSGKIGISLKQTIETERIKLSVPQAISSGLNQTWKTTVLTVQGFGKIFSGQEDFRKSVGGPIKIARIANQSAEQGPISFMYFVAVLSISLAIINILPIPALDGGQFVLNAIEGVMGREIPFEVKMRIQQVGMTLLLMFFAYFMINDLLNP
ncbi:RIP metalloprotease RseP [Chlorobaculum sp. MV4-Y]|jgi:regulator of sigma E protease|uniref:RIP metalloprotease RseP n=1 Tax=Chlorobaculum sp. MV4-Y TaxID=2976335 RepID=UPI0021B04C01|nr:RIP metalloprotease RseP [Chlorobaculum sp. MV4-Y]UWX57749.1 RIP metalloprotease RseP [Chlorobaculum sp. MV4-Y]